MKRAMWLIKLPGYKPFPMVSSGGHMTHEEAVQAARLIWPQAEVIE